MYLFKVTLNWIEIPNDAMSWVRNVEIFNSASFWTGNKTCAAQKWLLDSWCYIVENRKAV